MTALAIIFDHSLGGHLTVRMSRKGFHSRAQSAFTKTGPSPSEPGVLPCALLGTQRSRTSRLTQAWRGFPLWRAQSGQSCPGGTVGEGRAQLCSLPTYCPSGWVGRTHGHPLQRL